MDSLIHYRPADAAWALAKWSQRAAQGVLFTFAPRTPALSVMHALGRVLPRGSRSPAIVPISVGHMQALIAGEPGLSGWRAAQTERISSGFYKSQAMLLRRQ
jgi:magnesium-protoporphyrin O-methyltransferase